MDRNELSGKVDTLIAGLVAEIDSNLVSADVRERLKLMLARIRKTFVSMIGSGAFGDADWLKFEESMRQLVQHVTEPPPSWLPTSAQIEWLAFAEQLATRQGTRIPDWNEFYAERDALERRISEQGGIERQG